MTAVATKLDAGRRPDIEKDLDDKYHVGWSYRPGVPTSEFDIDASLNNQARFEAVHEDTVEQYAEAVKRGDAFPAVVAYRPRKAGKLIIVDGNHRLVAHDRAGQPIDVYEIASGTRNAVIALMTFALNTRHGRPISEAERIEHAMHLVDSGASQDDAAASMNVPARILKRELAKRAANQRADEVGLDRREWEGLPASARGRLLNVSTDEGFRDAAHLAFAARLDTDEIFEMVATLNATRSAAKQRAIIKAKREEFQDRVQDAAGGILKGKGDRGRAVTPRARVALVLGQIHALPDDIAMIGRLYQGPERETAAQSLIDASQRLRKIAYELNPNAK